MTDSRRDFFVSYNKADKQWAEWIAAVLEQAGYACYLQVWDFRPGDNFIVKMQTALTKSERFIPILSPAYVSASYCQAELAAALTKDPNSEKRLIVPVRVADFEPEGLLAAIIYIDLFGIDEATAEKLLLHGVDTKDIPRPRPPFPGAVKARPPFPGVSGERPSGTLPLNNLPYRRNDYFTGRDDVFAKIRAGFESGNTISLTQTITGLGGLGKTQTALEYAYRYAPKYDLIWWVPAETDATVIETYRKIALELGIVPSERQSDAQVINAVLAWMDTHDKWLFIYDNLDEFRGDTPWWPRENRENIIVTTRNQHITVGRKVDIEVFSKEEALAFLEKRTGINTDPQTALTLAGRLDYLPLALEQAAAYIAINEIPYAAYISLFDDYGLDALEEMEGVTDYPASVTVTFGLAIDKINFEPARQMLYLCAYLAPENIDEALFRENAGLLPPELGEAMANRLEGNKVWRQLTRYSLLKKQEVGKGYSMHRLLQKVVRSRIGQDPQWAECCLALFYKVYRLEYGDVDSHNRFILYSPYVQALLENISLELPSTFADKDQQIQIAYLYHEGGYGSNKLGNYKQALEWYQKALNIKEKVLGNEHSSTATTYNNIALVYDNQGDYPMALEWYQKALAIWEKAPSKEHPDTATTYNNIGGVYNSQGHYPEALEWHQKALDIREKVLGKEHPDTATTYNNIGGVYDSQGNYPQALEWYQKALAIREKVLGKEHPSTAINYNNIAFIYGRQGNYPEALEWCQKALDIFEQKLGHDHPYTILVRKNMSRIPRQ